MDCNILGGAGHGDLAQLAPATADGFTGGFVPFSEVAALVRRRLEEFEFLEREFVQEIGAPIDEAPRCVLETWLERFDWIARRLALAHLSDTDALGY